MQIQIQGLIVNRILKGHWAFWLLYKVQVFVFTLDLRGGVLSIVIPIWLRISANCLVLMPQLLATLLSHRRWMFMLHTSHFKPCRIMPYSNEPQWSQNVSRLNEWTENLCGIFTLNRWTASWFCFVCCNNRKNMNINYI